MICRALCAALLVCLVSSKCSYTTPNGTVDLSSVPTATLQINETSYYGGIGSYTFVVNLCRPVEHAPSNLQPCTSPRAPGGYVSQFSNSSCITMYDYMSDDWTYYGEKAGAGAYFNNLISERTMAVYLRCGPTLELQPDGPIVPNGPSELVMHLKTSAACGPHTPPKPAPANGTVTELKCKDKECRDCTGGVVEMGACTSHHSGRGSEKAVSCSRRMVTFETWSRSSTCSPSSRSTKTELPVSKCVKVGHDDYRHYSCSP